MLLLVVLPSPRHAIGSLLQCLLLATLTCAVHDVAADDLENLIVDTDPAGFTWSGLDVDDDLAILALVAAASGCNPSSEVNIKILGFTTVAGNGPQRHTFSDASYICRRLNLTFPVLRGAAWWPPSADSIRPRLPTEASDFIVTTVMNASPKSVTLLALGPLTNVDAALTTEPLLAGLLKRVVIIGGDMRPDHLDLNLLSDIEAANRVLDSNVPKLLVPVQTCTQSVFARQHLETALDGCKAFSDQHGRRQDDTHEAAPIGCAPALLSKMQRQTWMMPMFINPRLQPVQDYPQSVLIAQGFVAWDIVGALLVTHPALFSAHQCMEQVRVKGGVMQWATAKCRATRQNHSNFVSFYGLVDGEGVLRTALALIFRCHAMWARGPARDEPVPLILQMGLAPELLGLVLVLVALLLRMRACCCPSSIATPRNTRTKRL